MMIIAIPRKTRGAIALIIIFFLNEKMVFEPE